MSRPFAEICRPAVDKRTLLEQIADHERELFAKLKERAALASQGVQLEHAIDAIHLSIEKKRATIRRIENAIDTVDRRTAGRAGKPQRRN